MRTLVITPTYVEAENIDEFLRRARAALPSADILVVDDNSPDGTADIAEAAAAELGGIDVLRRPAKQGLGTAYRAGFAIGLEKGYEALVQIDADLSHDPAVLPNLLREVESGVDLAIGSRYVPGGAIPNWPWFRRALSRYGNRYAAFVLGSGVKDATSGYRAYRADTLKSIDYATTRAKGYGFQIETEYRVHVWGGHISEIPIVFTDRVRGYSKMTWFIFAEELLLVTWWGIRDRARRLWRRFRPG
ncbi:MAG TPA: polyprenol monophosphomannose synthase [Acidimicrobiia bacterium]|nr:polyprenol monophosphomannose synthase [Acidimicrobiia bacterium]